VLQSAVRDALDRTKIMGQERPEGTVDHMQRTAAKISLSCSPADGLAGFNGSVVADDNGGLRLPLSRVHDPERTQLPPRFQAASMTSFRFWNWATSDSMVLG
jgi:hypothetical protein